MDLKDGFQIAEKLILCYGEPIVHVGAQLMGIDSCQLCLYDYDKAGQREEQDDQVWYKIAGKGRMSVHDDLISDKHKKQQLRPGLLIPL